MSSEFLSLSPMFSSDEKLASCCQKGDLGRASTQPGRKDDDVNGQNHVLERKEASLQVGAHLFFLSRDGLDLGVVTGRS